MSRPAIYWQMFNDTENQLRLLGELDAISSRMSARVPDALRAAAYDASPSGEGTAWCVEHEREVAICRRRTLPCRGVPLLRASDRTGEIVVGQVIADAWTMQDCADMIHVATEAMLKVAARYGPEPDPAAEKITEGAEEANKPKCQIHMRHGWDVESETKNPTRLAHEGRYLLEYPLRLCVWCRRFVIAENGKLPSDGQVRKHAAKSNLPQIVTPPTRPVDLEWDERGGVHVEMAG